MKNKNSGKNSHLLSNTMTTTLTITVKSLTGNMLFLEMVEPDTTVGDFKKAVCAGFGGNILPCRQRLIWNGKQLEDHRQLDSYALEAPILIHMVLRMFGGTCWLPEIETTYPHQANLRNICVNGRHWWDIPAPKPITSRCHNWFPEGIHEEPAPIELYGQLIQEIRNTSKTVEQVGHFILTEYGYVKQHDGFYHLPADHPTFIARQQAKKEKEAKEELARLVNLWLRPAVWTEPVRCVAFNNLIESEVVVVRPMATKENQENVKKEQVTVKVLQIDP